MNNKPLYSLVLLLVVILSACGPAPEPTLSANDIANTALADAWMVVTLTQAALPSATTAATQTPLPALPALTLPPTVPIASVSPTTAPATMTYVAASATCNNPPPYQPQGLQVRVQFLNRSNGTVMLSFGMNEPNSLGECGTYNFNFGRYDEPVQQVLAGCYWAFAYVTGDIPSNARNVRDLCVTNDSKTWKIEVGAEVIDLTN